MINAHPLSLLDVSFVVLASAAAAGRLPDNSYMRNIAGPSAGSKHEL
jgi:hypothetical protein